MKYFVPSLRFLARVVQDVSYTILYPKVLTLAVRHGVGTVKRTISPVQAAIIQGYVVGMHQGDVVYHPAAVQVPVLLKLFQMGRNTSRRRNCYFLSFFAFFPMRVIRCL